jgi:hypothetical protein
MALQRLGMIGKAPSSLNLLAHFLAVVGFVSRNRQWRLGRVEHIADDLTVVSLAARHRKVQRPTLAIDDEWIFVGVLSLEGGTTGPRGISILRTCASAGCTNAASQALAMKTRNDI